MEVKTRLEMDTPGCKGIYGLCVHAVYQTDAHIYWCWPCTPAGWTQGSSLMVTSWTRVWVVPFWTSFFCSQVINSRHWEPCFFLFSGFHIWGRICALCVFLCLIFFTYCKVIWFHPCGCKYQGFILFMTRVFYFVYIPHFLYLFIHWWTLLLIPHLSFCEQCCDKHGNTNFLRQTDSSVVLLVRMVNLFLLFLLIIISKCILQTVCGRQICSSTFCRSQLSSVTCSFSTLDCSFLASGSWTLSPGFSVSALSTVNSWPAPSARSSELAQRMSSRANTARRETMFALVLLGPSVLSPVSSMVRIAAAVAVQGRPFADFFFWELSRLQPRRSRAWCQWFCMFPVEIYRNRLHNKNIPVCCWICNPSD